MTRILITGVTGQDGFYLSQAAHERGYEVFGLVRGQNNPKLAMLCKELPFIVPVEGDLLDRHSICLAMDQARPDYVFNLGAITYIPLSWQQPELVYNVNFLGVQRLLEEAADHNVKAFVQASTSEMFGSAKLEDEGDLGFDQDSNMLPSSPYAIAKLAAHHLCLAYRSSALINAIS